MSTKSGKISAPAPALQLQLIKALEADLALLDMAISHEQNLGQALLQLDPSNMAQRQAQVEAVEQDWSKHNLHRDALIQQILHVSGSEAASIPPQQIGALLSAAHGEKYSQLIDKIKKRLNSWSALRSKNSESIRGGLALINRLAQPLAPQQAGTYTAPRRRR